MGLISFLLEKPQLGVFMEGSLLYIVPVIENSEKYCFIYGQLQPPHCDNTVEKAP